MKLVAMVVCFFFSCIWHVGRSIRVGNDLDLT